MPSIDPEKIDKTARYKLLIGSVVPRPIAFVSTISRELVPNLAPFSFFNAVSSSPMMVMVAIARKKVGDQFVDKDTLRNILETKEFVVNSVSETIVDQMHQSSAEYPPEVSEFEAVGLTPEPSHRISPPRVQEAPVQFECVLDRVISLGDHPGATQMVLGRVVLAHFIDSALDERGRVQIEALKPIGRVGGRGYCRLSDLFEKPAALVNRQEEEK